VCEGENHGTVLECTFNDVIYVYRYFAHLTKLHNDQGLGLLDI